jgi:hypothetical protein
VLQRFADRIADAIGPKVGFGINTYSHSPIDSQYNTE